MYLSAFENPIYAIDDIFQTKILFLELIVASLDLLQQTIVESVFMYILNPLFGSEAQRSNPQQSNDWRELVYTNTVKEMGVNTKAAKLDNTTLTCKIQ